MSNQILRRQILQNAQHISMDSNTSYFLSDTRGPPLNEFVLCQQNFLMNSQTPTSTPFVD